MEKCVRYNFKSHVHESSSTRYKELKSTKNVNIGHENMSSFYPSQFAMKQYDHKIIYANLSGHIWKLGPDSLAFSKYTLI